MSNTVRKRKVNIPRRPVIGAKSKAVEKQTDSNLTRETIALILIVIGVFIGLALYSHVSQKIYGNELYDTQNINIMGVVGDSLANFLFSLLGYCAFVTVFWAFLFARTIWVLGNTEKKVSFQSFVFSFISSLFMAVACSITVSILFEPQSGGYIGIKFSNLLVRYLNKPGALLISISCFLLSFGYSTGIDIPEVFSFFKKINRQILSFMQRRKLSFISAVFIVCSHLFSTLVKTPVRILKATFLRLRSTNKSKDRARSSRNIPPRSFSLGDSENTDYEPIFKLDTQLIDDDDINNTLKISRGTVKPEPKLKDRILRRKPKSRIEKKANFAEEPIVISNFELPPLDLLVSNDLKKGNLIDDAELVRNSKRLEQALLDFRIEGKIVEVHPGPVITLYQFEPAAGVKVNRIVNLADDLALALKVGNVRVYAPVPGKGTVGIEVPNSHREIVRLRDLLECADFAQTTDKALNIALGKDTFGEPFVADLSRMPHLLIAGATGTGKSVCINSVMLSLLYRHTPSELRLIMIDPKMLELSIYEDIPHLKAPVVTNPKRARGVFWWAVEEMERRYRMMKDLGVRDLAGYNRAILSDAPHYQAPSSIQATKTKIIELEEKDVIATANSDSQLSLISKDETSSAVEVRATAGRKPLPRIVIVVDELADLMLTVGREIEELLTRLAQKARAAGIHLILATQRPSVDVITGLIKANFPSRISFQVASRIDARTILDCSGAERLLGQGDMLFLQPGTNRLKRLHGAFVSDKEVQDVAQWLRQQGAPDYDPAIEAMIKKIDETEEVANSNNISEDEYDPLYDQAVNLVVEKGQASTSMVQRVFRIGYNRAARMLETMEKEGIVGPADGAKPRQVLMPNRDEAEIF